MPTSKDGSGDPRWTSKRCSVRPPDPEEFGPIELPNGQLAYPPAFPSYVRCELEHGHTGPHEFTHEDCNQTSGCRLPHLHAGPCLLG